MSDADNYAAETPDDVTEAAAEDAALEQAARDSAIDAATQAMLLAQIDNVQTSFDPPLPPTDG